MTDDLEAVAGCAPCAMDDHAAATYLGMEPGEYLRFVTEVGLGHDSEAHRIYRRLMRAGVTSCARLAGMSDAEILSLSHLGEYSLGRIRARLPEPPTVPPDELRVRFEDLLSSIWLYVPWEHVTKQLTTEQKELWADAIDANRARMNADEPHINLSPVERWWRQ